MMREIFQLDDQGYFTGASRSIEVGQGWPPGWVTTPPPEETPDLRACYLGGRWELRAPTGPSKDTLKAQLSAIRDAYCEGTTPFGDTEIAIDVEARINAKGTLDGVKDGSQPLPFLWFKGDQSVPVETVEDMQAIHDAIFMALHRGFTAKGIVLQQIEALTDTQGFDVRAAWEEVLVKRK